MNDIFKEFLSNLMVIYMDDILNYFLNLEFFKKYDILFSTNFSRKSCMLNCYHHSKVEFSGATWSSTMTSHWIGKKFKLLRSSLFGNLIFSLWCFMFLGICRFLSKIIQNLLFLWHNLQAMRNSNGYWRCCKRFQNFKECFHDNSHFNSCKLIKTILSWSKCFKFCSWCCVILVCEWWTTTSCWIPFKKVLSDQNKIWNSWQRFFGYPS